MNRKGIFVRPHMYLITQQKLKESDHKTILRSGLCRTRLIVTMFQLKNHRTFKIMGFY